MCVSTSYGSLELLLLVTFFRHFLASLINADEQGRFCGGIFFCFVSGAVELESSVSAVALSVSVSAVFSSDWLGSFSAVALSVSAVALSVSAVFSSGWLGSFSAVALSVSAVFSSGWLGSFSAVALSELFVSAVPSVGQLVHPPIQYACGRGD